MRIAVAIGAVLCAPAPAGACIPVFTRSIVGAPVFEPGDAVSVTSEAVDVACDEHYRCTVTSTFAIAVNAPARASVTGHDTFELGLRVGNSPLAVAGDAFDDVGGKRASVELAVGDTALTIHARAELPGYEDGCSTDGVIVRHPYFGGAAKPTAYVLEIETSAPPHLRVPASLSLEVDARSVSKPATRIWFDAPARWFTHGGPIVMNGSRSGEGESFRARGGWEAAIGAPSLVASLVGETDFGDAWNVALIAEPTTSASMLPLTLGAGAGIVLAEGMRVGARGQLSIALGAVRTMLSADVVKPRDGDGSYLTIAGLVGVSL